MNYSSLQFDKFIEIMGTTKFSIFIWMVLFDMLAKEEFLTIPLKEQSHGLDIYEDILS